MEKKNLDWANLGFGYMPTDYRYVANYRDGKWDKGALITDDKIVMSECAGVLQYAQTVFEGMKAYETVDGRTVVFRPDLNAERLVNSAKRLEIPPISPEQFLDGVRQVVKADEAWVPPYGTGASLYIRPYMFGISPVIGVKPAEDYQFRILTTPVGPYFKGGAKPIKITISDYDLEAIVEAHQNGFNENMYLDSATRTKVEETGGANFVFFTKDGTMVTPKSDTILPSVTRRSLEYVAEKYLGMKVEERVVYKEELDDFVEAGVCGTAAVICPIGLINDHGREIRIPSGMDEMGPNTKKLYDTLRGIQLGTIEAPEGWIFEIK